MGTGQKRDMRNECYRCTHSRGIAGDAHIKCISPDTEMEGDEHGRKQGWFMYPFNFDPCWKTKDCRNFDPLTPESGGEQENPPTSEDEVNLLLTALSCATNKDVLWCVMKRNGHTTIVHTQMEPSASWDEVEGALSTSMTGLVEHLKAKEAKQVGR